MSKPTHLPSETEPPVIMVIDDDPAVLSAVTRDLRAAFGAGYRVRPATSAEDALVVLRQLRLRGACVALVISDQRMPGMSGLDLLREVAALHPSTKRVLLTAWADDDVAIRGINEVRLDHYLLKPWDPPEDHLYPMVADLLDDWQAQRVRPERGVRIVGHAWSPDAHALRDFLVRNMVPFHWLDVEADDEARALVHAAGFTGQFPLVVLPDGTVLERPDARTIAARLGIASAAGARVYDMVVVGAGPAGLAAAMYAASEGVRTLVLERDAPGGQAGRSRRIENYLGFPIGLSGGDLARRAVAQARRFGAEIATPVEAVAVQSRDGYHTLDLSDGTCISARAVIITAGVSYRTLDVPGAEPLTGRGIYYGAALAEQVAVRDRDVFVLGGGNSAGQAALFLARFARSVTLLVRAGSLAPAMSHYLIQQVDAAPNVHTRLHVALEEVHGYTRMDGMTLRDLGTGVVTRIAADALFVFIGAAARTDWLGDTVERDADGYILAGADLPRSAGRPRNWPLRREPLHLETSVPGIFAAGDVRHRSAKGVSAAVGEGAMAAQLVRQYLGGALLWHSAAPPRQEVPPLVMAQ
jgi:thioredoxin reductase (NADPH)